MTVNLPKNKLSTSLLFCWFLFVFVVSSCKSSEPTPVIRVVIININQPTATAQVETQQSVVVSSTATTIAPLYVTTDTPVISSCNCNGVPNVTVSLHVTGGVPPYKLANENLQIEGDSYLLPLEGELSKSLIIQSYDGQEYEINIPIDGCPPPPACSSVPPKTKRPDSPDVHVSGCADPKATNYNPLATKDDGSCTYVLGCTDPKAKNYNPLATKDDGLCKYDVLGCMDPKATNYNSLATKDDGSCKYDVLGCMDPKATNYNSLATKDDGSCKYDVLGCTDPKAKNYNPLATKDDGSCKYDVLGCMDPKATNYNPLATKDDGSCTYPPPPKSCRDGLDNNGNGLIDWPADPSCQNKNDVED